MTRVDVDLLADSGPTSSRSYRIGDVARYDTAREPELVAMLRDASRDISRQLGCSTFPLDTPEPARR